MTDESSTGKARVLRPSWWVAGAFDVLARLRRARAFHPRGLFLAGELTVEEGAGLALPAGTRPVIARMSKGVGTPGGRPDVLGLAVRVPPWAGQERPWDLLLSSTGAGQRSRLLPIPARSWGSARYGSLAPYLLDGRRVWVLAVARDLEVGEPASLEWLERRVAAAPVRFTLHVVCPGLPARQVASLTLRVVPSGLAEHEVRFDPVVNCLPDLPMVPRWLRWVRRFAYQGSRRGHRAPADSLRRVPPGPGE
ncbi:hypothetical protein [Streptoalloteichus hindustanus]|uniref:Phosphodiesterase n=1 Tax=Streptoalloteichus hindustanus TaxID=2017 RepID=A0A1M5DQJ8_STRHI|nr:hypothetical protein [Streptoalloteichus hindustanus]SHF69308.1 hypothetical protein SAMN05444320_104564 [Streptoalloteichus hindustanus]